MKNFTEYFKKRGLTFKALNTGNLADSLKKASFTIEASLVMPIVFFAVVLLIIIGFKMHDIVLSNVTANEVVELYSHMPEDGDIREIEGYGNRILQNKLSTGEYSVSMEEYKDGSRAELNDSGDIRTYEDGGSHPEKLMRELTIVEKIL